MNPIGLVYLALLVIVVLAVSAHALAAWWRRGNETTDQLVSGEPRYTFRRVPPRRRSPDVQVTRVHRVLDDMPHH